MSTLYRHAILIMALLVIFAMIMADHLTSTTFSFNAGDRSVDTVLKQREKAGRECPPCAPCPK